MSISTAEKSDKETARNRGETRRRMCFQIKFQWYRRKLFDFCWAARASDGTFQNVFEWELKSSFKWKWNVPKLYILSLAQVIPFKAGKRLNHTIFSCENGFFPHFKLTQWLCLIWMRTLNHQHISHLAVAFICWRRMNVAAINAFSLYVTQKYVNWNQWNKLSLHLFMFYSIAQLKPRKYGSERNDIWLWPATSFPV